MNQRAYTQRRTRKNVLRCAALTVIISYHVFKISFPDLLATEQYASSAKGVARNPTKCPHTIYGELKYLRDLLDFFEDKFEEDLGLE